MKVFVDTSALIALLDADDRHHAEARATFEWLARSAELVTHNYVEVEALAVTRRRLGIAAADALLTAFLPLIHVAWVDQPLHREALAAQRAASGSGSLVDHVSFTMMRGLGIELAFAFDADFEEQGFRRPTVPRTTTPPRRLEEVPAPYGVETAPELVSVTEIAARSGRPVNTIQSWRRRHRDFPPPVAQLAAGPIWTWEPVSEWIDGRRRARGAT